MTGDDRQPRSPRDTRNVWSLRPTAIILAFFGVLALVAWYFTNNGTTTSTILMLAGIGVTVAGLMLYFVSPEKYLSSEVSDAISVSNALNVSRMLSALYVGSQGIYVPASEKGAIRVFIPLSPVADIGKLSPGNETLCEADGGIKGISLVPPGYGLFRYVQGPGVSFASTGLEDRIKNTLVNVLEIARSAGVRREGDLVTVSMRGMFNARLCSAVRKEDPRICTQTGCPICSAVGCMVVSGTGKRARIREVQVSRDNVTVTYELL